MSLVTPLIVLWFGALVLLPMDGRRTVVCWMAAAALLAATATASLLAAQIVASGPIELVTGGWDATLGIALGADLLSMAFLVSALLLLTVVSVHVAGSEIRRRKLPAGLLFTGVGLTGLFLTRDLFNFYVFFEVTMAASFFLVSQGEKDRQHRSALLFTLANVIGSSFYLGGTAAAYHVTGSLQMEVVAQWARTGSPDVQLMTATLFFAAFGLKLGTFPFHFWTPVVYGDSPHEISAVFAGPLAGVGSYGLIRFGSDIFVDQVTMAHDVLLGLGLASILFGALVAARGRTLCEILAYSSISQTGYILVAVAIDTRLGTAAAVLLALANMTQKTGLFLATAARGAFALAAFAVGSASLAGIPLTAGFLAKVFLVYAAAAADLPAVVVMLVGASGIAIVYAFRAYHRFEAGERSAREASVSMSFLLAGLVVAAAAWPQPLLQGVKMVAEELREGPK